MDCQHIQKSNFHPEIIRDVLAKADKDKLYCSECKLETDSRWLCLECGIISCGRFVKGHALKHHQSTKHTASLDLITKACHCYVCDDYVNAGEMEPLLDQFRKELADILSGIEPKVEVKSSGPKTRNVTGLANLGNTCYMNVVLQILVHTSPLQKYFIQSLISPMTPVTTSSSSRITTRSAKFVEHTLWTQLCNILLELWETKEMNISPDNFLQFMRRSLPAFVGYQQQDAQEFMRALLDKVHCELESKKGRTMIMQTFQGNFKSQITCDSCKRDFVKEELFLDVSLPLPDELNSLQELIAAFTKEETLLGDDMYSCDVCKKLNTAKKRMIFAKLPPILVFHLKRFRFTQARSKIDRLITFPTTLEMSSYHEDGEIYYLYGVIVHRGTAGQGHYVAYINHQGSWYEMNDRQSTQLTEAQVLKQPAYMLFYDVKSPNSQFFLHSNFKLPTKKRKVNEIQ